MTRRERARRPRADTQQKLEHLLSVAAGLIAEKGYEQTAIRDVGRETGVSLPGLYYYFKSKEDLLFQIQQRTFGSLLEAQQAEFDAAVQDTPQRKLRRLIVGHLAFYARHPKEMKVCTFELESLRGEPYGEIAQVRRRYYHLVAEVVRQVLECEGRGDEGGLLVRHLTLFVFGMLNWIFMWYDPQRDGSVERLGEEMAAMALHGIAGGAAPQSWARSG
ncbi:MAG: TetR/AcrR family transcriptional regulator [Bacteroidales bacterium]